MSYFETIKNFIRGEEILNGVRPLKIDKINQNNEKDGWKLSFNKQILYQNDVDQTKRNFFKASSPLNTEVHEDLLQRFLQNSFPKATFEVKVAPKFATVANIPLKIPYTNIGIKRGSHKVRERDANDKMLATVSSKIKIKITGDTTSITGPALWEALNQAACLHSKNQYENINKDIAIIANDLAGRESKNVARLLKSQSKPYGFSRANYLIDQPIFHRGVTATAANTAGVVVAAVATIVIAYVGLKQIERASASPSAMVGFALGSSANPSLVNGLFGSAIAQSSKPGSFFSGYGNGLLFSQTSSLITQIANSAADTLHMPFATRSVIKPK